MQVTSMETGCNRGNMNISNRSREEGVEWSISFTKNIVLQCLKHGFSTWGRTSLGGIEISGEAW